MGVLNHEVANTLAKTRRPRLVHLLHRTYAALHNEKPEQQLMQVRVQSATSIYSTEHSPV
jgi:hypothetical protein